MGLKLLSGAQGSQSCAPTDPRREVENLGEHEGQPVTLWGVRGAMKSQGRSRDQREARMARLGFLKHDTRGAKVRDYETSQS